MLPWLWGSILACFVVSSSLSFLEIRRFRKSLEQDQVPRSGKEMRVVFLGVLFVGNAARALAMLVELPLWQTGLCPDAWGCTFVRLCPNLFFLTAFSLLALFWAQLRGAITNYHNVHLGSFFKVWNGLLYAAFIVLALFGATAALEGWVYEAWLTQVLGCYYLSALFFVAYYGVAFVLAFPEGSMVEALVAAACCCNGSCSSALPSLSGCLECCGIGGGPTSGGFGYSSSRSSTPDRGGSSPVLHTGRPPSRSRSPLHAVSPSKPGAGSESTESFRHAYHQPPHSSGKADGSSRAASGEGRATETRGAILGRLVGMCAICSAVLLLESFYFLAPNSVPFFAGEFRRVSSESGAPPDTLSYILFELFPSLALLCVLSHRKAATRRNQRPSPTTLQAAAFKSREPSTDGLRAWRAGRQRDSNAQQQFGGGLAGNPFGAGGFGSGDGGGFGRGRPGMDPRPGQYTPLMGSGVGGGGGPSGPVARGGGGGGLNFGTMRSPMADPRSFGNAGGGGPRPVPFGMGGGGGGPICGELELRAPPGGLPPGYQQQQLPPLPRQAAQAPQLAPPPTAIAGPVVVMPVPQHLATPQPAQPPPWRHEDPLPPQRPKQAPTTILYHPQPTVPSSGSTGAL